MKELEEYLELLRNRLITYQKYDLNEDNKVYWRGVLSATQTHIEELEPIVNELTKIEL